MAFPFTREELMDLWRSVVDPSYSEPLLKSPEGIALIEAVAEEFARLSEMVNKDAQATFIMPYSGQTGEPAAGASQATVRLRLTRGGDASGEVTIVRGQAFEAVLNDYGPDGSVLVQTGRLYVAARNYSIVPGATELVIDAVAEKPGYGYNLPRPGTITRIVQIGAGMTNDGGTLIAGVASHQLVLAPRADAVGPQHVGQYVLFQGGPNDGQRRRVIGFIPPVNSAYAGVAVLAATGVLGGSIFSDFTPGEIVEQAITGAQGRLIEASSGYLVYDRTTFQDFDIASPILGVESGAMLIPDAILQSPTLVAGRGMVWRVLDFASDLMIAATNDASPEGGKSAMLDEIGMDRDVQRSPGELDDKFRQRVWKLPDVVSPNALKRSMNRVLAEYGAAGCLREVGDVSGLFPGFFFDVAPADVDFDPRYAYAYDLDFAIRPQDRFKLVMDYVEFRAFFDAGVPPSSLGDFGFFYDVVGQINFYDDAPYLSFFDGFPATSAVVNRRVWDALYKAHAGGVSFTLYDERLGCF